MNLLLPAAAVAAFFLLKKRNQAAGGDLTPADIDRVASIQATLNPSAYTQVAAEMQAKGATAVAQALRAQAQVISNLNVAGHPARNVFDVLPDELRVRVAQTQATNNIPLLQSLAKELKLNAYFAQAMFLETQASGLAAQQGAHS